MTEGLVESEKISIIIITSSIYIIGAERYVWDV
jgi:hypothetical protein